jgi:hypothetical protein
VLKHVVQLQADVKCNDVCLDNIIIIKCHKGTEMAERFRGDLIS